MSVYKSAALLNLTGMTKGAGPLGDNAFWHWYKHAAAKIGLGFPTAPDVRGAPTVQDYLKLANAICRDAASGCSGTEVRYREGTSNKSEIIASSYVVWYQPDPTLTGLFLAVKDCHDHGELITMFAPDDGYDYFEREAAKGAVLLQ